MGISGINRLVSAFSKVFESSHVVSYHLVRKTYGNSLGGHISQPALVFIIYIFALDFIVDGSIGGRLGFVAKVPVLNLTVLNSVAKKAIAGFIFI